jgi:hypothetical protein
MLLERSAFNMFSNILPIFNGAYLRVYNHMKTIGGFLNIPYTITFKENTPLEKISG